MAPLKLRKYLKRGAGRLGYSVVKQEELRNRREQDARQIVAALSAAEDIDLPENPYRLQLLAELIGTTVAEGLFILAGLHSSMECEGDVCEFGVAQGATSALLANELRLTEKTLWLYDSFQGLSAPTEEDELIDDIDGLGSMDAYAGRMAYGQEVLVGRLAQLPEPFDRYRMVKGFFRNEPSTPGPESISFAYIDFDFYQPIKEALEFVDGRLPVGAVVVIDDYGHFSAGAQKAVDEFVEGRAGRFEPRYPDTAYGHFCVLTRIT